MFNHRQNIGSQPMSDMTIKQVTPIRGRIPTPIRKMPTKMIPNKENNGRVVQQTQDLMLDNKMIIGTDKAKKPLISPVRNPFKNQIEAKQLFHAPSNNMNRNKYNTNNNYTNYQEQDEQEDIGHCNNHPNKIAQYISSIQDAEIYYCGKCAAQLASQGFQVRRIVSQTVKKGDNPRNIGKGGKFIRELPRYPQYQGNPMYEHIIDFLKQLTIVQQQHHTHMDKLSKIDEHYTQQIMITRNFYEQLAQIVEQMKQDHIADLVEQSRKHSQIAAIQHDYLRENADEMQGIRNDIEQNLETIVEKLDEEQLKNNLNYYRQKIQVYRHKTEEQSDFFDQLINFSEGQVQGKLNSVQNYLMDVWNENSQNNQRNREEESNQQNLGPNPRFIAQNNHMNHNMGNNFYSNNQHEQYGQYQQKQNTFGNNLPRNIMKKQSQEGQNENQPAFRRLFEDEDQLMAETSPQFKKI